MIIKLTVDRVENDKVVLITSDGQTIIWPKSKLPDDIHDGSCLSFDIKEKGELEKQSQQTAENIINEIINHS